MAEQSADYLSRLQEYKQRLDDLMDEARGQVERQAPDALAKMATTARTIAQRLDDMASDVRQRAKEREAAPEAAGTSDRASDPPGEPPVPPVD
ncbi:MAG TPA: hypothetical protein VD765_01335 [Solirubrobacterales bacterium]|nr:hypothetical protein [Solirubrobacterales bacterium]